MRQSPLAVLTHALYPPSCLACRADVQDAGALCPSCWREVTFISGSVCDCCGAPVADGGPALCDDCAARPPVFSRGRAAMIYDGAARRLVLALKHGDRVEIATVAAPWLARAGRDLLAEADVITPIPLHWSRLVRRRFNQSAELARALARVAGVPAAPDLLRRARATASQDGKSRDERRANVDGAFVTPRHRRAVIAGKRIVLLDDVMTTGATFSAAAEACLAAGAASVTALALTRVARGDRPPV